MPTGKFAIFILAVATRICKFLIAVVVPSTFYRVLEGGSKEEIEALLEEYRNRRPEIIEEFLQ